MENGNKSTDNVLPSDDNTTNDGNLHLVIESTSDPSSGTERTVVKGGKVRDFIVLHGGQCIVDNRKMPALPSTSQGSCHNQITCETTEKSHEDVQGSSRSGGPQYMRKFSNKSDEYNKIFYNLKDNFLDSDEYMNKAMPLVNPKSKISSSSLYYREESKKASQYVRDMGVEFYETIYDKDMSTCDTDYSSLMDFIMNSDKKRFAIVGEAGAGKTTLLKRLSKDFTTSEQRPLVIVFRYFSGFCNLTETTPCKMFFGNLPTNTAGDCEEFQWLIDNQESLIFFLDGLDQAEWSVGGKNIIYANGAGTEQVIMSNLFMRTLFPDSKVIFSSREFSVVNLYGKFRPDVVITLTGLSDSDAKLLFTSLIGDRGEEAWSKLVTQSNSIVPLLSTPAFLRFTVCAYDVQSNNPPKNATGIMHNLIQLFKRSEHIDAESDIEKILSALRVLAYHGMVERRVMYRSEDFKDTGLNESQISSLVITVTGINLPNQRLLEGDRVYYYSHQSIQEFLTGEHITDMDLPSFEEVVQKHLTDDHWYVVTRYVAGILLNRLSKSAPISDLQDKRMIFTNMISKLKKRHQNNLQFLSILAESDDTKLIQESVGDIIDFSMTPISSSGMYVVASIIRHCSKLEKANFSGCNINISKAKILWENINESNVQISHIDLSGNEIDFEFGETVGQVISKCHVNTVTMQYCNLTDASLDAILGKLEGVKISHIDLSGNKLDGKSGAKLGEIIQKCCVREVIMHDCKLTDASIDALLCKAESAKISVLDLSDSEIRCEDDGTHTEAKAESANISVLDLSESEISEDDGTHTEDSNQCEIGQLRMWNCQFSEEFLDAFLSMTHEVKIFHLRLSKKELPDADADTTIDSFPEEVEDMKASCIDLSGCKINDEVGAVVGEIIRKCRVNEVIMRECELTHVSLDNLLWKVEDTKISLLDLSKSTITVDKNEILAENVKRCEIESLRMWSCELSEKYLASFLSVIHGVKISNLNIFGSDVDTNAFKLLGKASKKCMISSLDIQKCNLTDEELNAFLSEARGAKLSKLNVSGNYLSPNAIEEIEQYITVEELVMGGQTEVCDDDTQLELGEADSFGESCSEISAADSGMDIDEDLIESGFEDESLQVEN